MTAPDLLSHRSPDDRTVSVGIAAERDSLPIVRGVASKLAITADLTVDEIADVTLAVDETCSTLITLAAPDSALDCRFDVRRSRVRFRASVRARGADAVPDRTSFGWRVLTRLTDTLDAHLLSSTGSSVSRLRVEFTRTGSGR